MVTVRMIIIAILTLAILGVIACAIYALQGPSKKKVTEKKDATEKKKRWEWLTVKRIVWTIIIVLLCILLLPEIKYIALIALNAFGAGIDGAVNGTPRSEWGLTLEPPSNSRQIPIRRTENADRYQFFVDTPRKLGWKVLPTEVDFDIPLDGVPRYMGLNVAFLGGSRLRIECPGYRSGGMVKLFAKGDGYIFSHLGHKNVFPLTESGSVTGGGAILVKGEKDERYKAVSNRIHAEVEALSGHHRIATTKVCETGMGIAYDWGTVQVGEKDDSPPWQLYIRFADMNGITLKPSVVQQKPGQIMLLVKEGNGWREIFSEIVSQPANVYGSYVVPRGEKDPMLRIQTPNLPESKMIVEVILDIDNTK